MPKDQQHQINHNSPSVKHTHVHITPANPNKEPIIVEYARNHLRCLQCESRTLQEILNILKKRLNEARDTGNKKDLAQLWTKYHVNLRAVEQQIENDVIIIAGYQFEQTRAIQTTRIKDRLFRLNHILNTMRIQLESAQDQG